MTLDLGLLSLSSWISPKDEAEHPILSRPVGGRVGPLMICCKERFFFLESRLAS